VAAKKEHNYRDIARTKMPVVIAIRINIKAIPYLIHPLISGMSTPTSKRLGSRDLMCVKSTMTIVALLFAHISIKAHSRQRWE
jgi:hypothetical protein